MRLRSASRFMVVAGESGGHVFPAVAFCQNLKQGLEEASSIYFVATDTKDIVKWVPKEFRPVFLKIKKSVLGLFKLLIGAISTIWRINPDVVFGFGGYITVPFIILAKLSGKRTFIHEQNVVPGRANRFLSIFADKVIVSFEKTKMSFDNKKKVVLAQYPLRNSLLRVDRREAIKFFNLDEYLFTVLVMGGSQGASRINNKFIEALKISSYRDRIQVIHLCGKDEFEEVSAAYEHLSVNNRVYAFLDEMQYAYSACDLVISRSGAGSVFEIMHFALPSILIPYPYAGGHQMENARFLAEKGAAILLEDSKMSPEMINGLLEIFLDDVIRRKTMSKIADQLSGACCGIQLKDVMSA